ncbi:MAG: amidohydrolase family protein [Bacteroidia bacterium]|nr:amidohydrolase family protein [Bacteroidia bacterium]
MELYNDILEAYKALFELKKSDSSISIGVGAKDWKEDIKQLAMQNNVYCKLSGMVTEASWQGWSKDDFVPYLDVIFDSFGPSRLMIGSDWPVCTLASDYKNTLQILFDYIACYSQADKDLILGRNAERIYNIRLGSS